MALNKRVFRILKENILRYIGILMLIILGSYTFVLAAGLSQNLDTLVTTFTERHMQEDLSFSTDRAISDRAELEKGFNAIIDEYMSFDAKLSDTLTLRLLSETEKLNIPAIIEGRGLSGSGEILLDPAFAEANGYSVGSQIEAAGKQFTVVGFVSLPHYIYPLKNVYDIMVSPDNFGVGVINREEFADIDNAATIYSVRFHDRTQSLNKQATQLRERLHAEGITESDWIDIMNNKRARMAWASITGLKTMSVPLPAAMFLLCCLIIGITIWRMIRHESVIIGTFYAQGYRRRELMRHYMAIPLLLAIGGGVIGSVLALPSIEPSVMAMVSYYNVPVTNIELSALNVLIGILTPVLFLGASSYLVIRLELKRSPAELMKGDKQKTKVNALERAFKLERFKFSTKFKLREQLRSISRLLFLFLGVTSASVLMLFGFTIMNSMNHAFNTVSDVYQFEYEYAFRDLQFGEAPEGAVAFNAGRFYPENNEGIEFYITGIESDSTIVTLKDSKGNPISNNQTNITKPLANRLGIKAGDTVTFINKENGKPYTFHIDAVADSYVEQFIYVPITEFNKKLGFPENSYMGLFSTKKLDIPDEKLSGVKSMSEVSGMDELLGQMVSMVALMTIVSSIVALIILYLVTSLIIEENRNTISLFKVFGYRRREIKSMILNSSTFVIVAGFIISIPIMAASMDAMYGYLGKMINLVLPTIISPLYVVVCFVVIMLTYHLSKLLCAKKVNTISMSEALKAGME
ncbi:putative ABC transport system permease protein [Anaerosolibacter carboniphilus]|uniref:Putative ABC transport system permease protein n=1 Tax=Anaerosolibacter carboniphilus TaxID=1417629 RepID=A0A841KPS9_9FIRM|nr:FtsX-like permease family protein [Anaerosolibacter carboniphilus]MBB6215341.1 putative ABC transport system permease protein [Anaerosolibacter carboniphilus]